MVLVAIAQRGKTQTEPGYTEAWGIDFVSDCAVPTGETPTALYETVVNSGETVVTDPAMGDAVKNIRQLLLTYGQFTASMV